MRVCESNVNNAKRRTGVLSKHQYTDLQIPAKSCDKSEDEKSLIRSALNRNHFLSLSLTKEQVELCVNLMYIEETAPNQTVFAKDDVGAHVYVIIDGTFQQIDDEHIKTLETNAVFGELAIIYTTKRPCTVKSLTLGKLFVLDCIHFRQNNIERDKSKQEAILSCINNVPFFNTFSVQKLQHLADLMKETRFIKGQKIIEENSTIHRFYVIKSGSVEVHHNDEKFSLRTGDWFGALNPIVSESTIFSASSTVCLTISCRVYSIHFNPMEYTVNLLLNSKLNDFEVLQTIGRGGYGKVQLVKHKKDSSVFAMKSLRDYDASDAKQLKNTLYEHDLHMCCDNRFIVKMYHTFTDNANIYAILEYCAGGDLFHLQQKQNKCRFDEIAARFYVACVVEAFDYLHGLKIVYRDLKPENVVIKMNGYAKLTDFGFAKRLTGERTTSFLGTEEYLAPEMVNSSPYDQSVDYWSLGVFVFELLTGRTPFREKNTRRTYTQILNGIEKVYFPNYMSYKAVMLVKKLCKLLPNDRLGYNSGGMAKIRKHSWFGGWNWEEFVREEMVVPFKPIVSHEI